MKQQRCQLTHKQTNTHTHTHRERGHRHGRIRLLSVSGAHLDVTVHDAFAVNVVEGKEYLSKQMSRFALCKRSMPRIARADVFEQLTCVPNTNQTQQSGKQVDSQTSKLTAAAAAAWMHQKPQSHRSFASAHVLHATARVTYHHGPPRERCSSAGILGTRPPRQ